MRRLPFLLVLLVASIANAAFADAPERVHAFIRQWDLNGDGKISLAEFETQSAKVRDTAIPILTTALVRDAFKAYDLNGDGFITEPEMQEINRRANLEASAGRKN